MRAFVEQTWGKWNEDRVRQESFEGCTSPNGRVVQLGGIDIGVVSVSRRPSHIQLERIYLLPEFQKLGVGSSLVRSFIMHAKSNGLPLRLSVLVVNPAKEFYAKLGFVVTEVTPERIHMEASVT